MLEILTITAVFTVLITFGYVLSLFLHEMSHYIVAKVTGAEVTAFKFYPHTYEDQFFMACVYTKNLKDEYKTLFYAAPLLKSVGLMFTWMTLGLVFWLPLCSLVLLELFDIGIWFKGYFFGSEHLDGAKFRKYYDLYN